MSEPVPLSDEEITEWLTAPPGWERKGDEITRAYPIRNTVGEPGSPSTPSADSYLRAWALRENRT